MNFGNPFTLADVQRSAQVQPTPRTYVNARFEGARALLAVRQFERDESQGSHGLQRGAMAVPSFLRVDRARSLDLSVNRRGAARSLPASSGPEATNRARGGPFRRRRREAGS